LDGASKTLDLLARHQRGGVVVSREVQLLSRRGEEEPAFEAQSAASAPRPTARPPG
jgi:hypothetical protein